MRWQLEAKWVLVSEHLKLLKKCWADRKRHTWCKFEGLWMRDGLKALPLPQLKAGRPQIPSALVACMD